MSSDDVKSLLYLGGAAAAAYVLYQLWQKIPSPAQVPAAVSKAAESASSSVADLAQSIFQTNAGIAQPGGTYTVTMSDGSVQTVPYGQQPKPIAQPAPPTAADLATDAGFALDGYGGYVTQRRRRRAALAGWENDPYLLRGIMQ